MTLGDIGELASMRLENVLLLCKKVGSVVMEHNFVLAMTSYVPPNFTWIEMEINNSQI